MGFIPLPMNQTKVYLKLFIFLVLVLQFVKASYHLELLQVVFRHGDRTPEKVELYPDLPYNASIYDDLGFGQLTSVGEVREYRIGVLLRELYNDFLGDTYQHGDVHAVSTDMDRTKMSLELVLSGLYPSNTKPKDQNISWIPIPLLYVPTIVDTMFETYMCPLYDAELERTLESPEISAEVSKYDDIYELVAENTGLDVASNPLGEVSAVYELLLSQDSMNIPRPAWVTDDVYEKMENITALAYNVSSYTTTLKRLNGGAIIKKFIENIVSNENNRKPKIHLYSAHDLNVGAFAKANDFAEPKVPFYGCTIIVEKLRDDNGGVFIQMKLWTGVTEILSTYEIPSCGTICPIERYLDNTRNVIPTDAESNCLWDMVTKDDIKKYYEENQE